MDWVLAAIAICFLVLALPAGTVWWLWKRVAQRWYACGLAASVHLGPGRIRLRPELPLRWGKRDRAERRIEAFREAGFEPLAGFAVDSPDEHRLLALHHPQTGLIGTVNESSEAGTWSDVMLFRADGQPPVLASDVIKPRQFHLLPGDPRIQKSEAPVAQLMETVRQAAGHNARTLAVTAGQFAGLYEEAWAEAADRRLLEPLEDYEIRRRILEAQADAEFELSDAQFARVKEALPWVAGNELRSVCAAEFLRTTTLSAAELEPARERLLVIHDRTELRELAGRLIQGAFLTKPIKSRLGGLRRSEGSPRERFARLNAQCPPWERYRKIGEVTRPVPADIYRAPIERVTT